MFGFIHVHLHVHLCAYVFTCVHMSLHVYLDPFCCSWWFAGRDPIDEMRKILDNLSTERSARRSGEGIVSVNRKFCITMIFPTHTCITFHNGVCSFMSPTCTCICNCLLLDRSPMRASAQSLLQQYRELQKDKKTPKVQRCQLVR